MLMWLDVLICGMSVFRSEAGAKHRRSDSHTLHDITSICGLRSRQTATPNLNSSFQSEV